MRYIAEILSFCSKTKAKRTGISKNSSAILALCHVTDPASASSMRSQRWPDRQPGTDGWNRDEKREIGLADFCVPASGKQHYRDNILPQQLLAE